MSGRGNESGRVCLLAASRQVGPAKENFREPVLKESRAVKKGLARLNSASPARKRILTLPPFPALQKPEPRPDLNPPSDTRSVVLAAIHWGFSILRSILPELLTEKCAATVGGSLPVPGVPGERAAVLLAFPCVVGLS